MKLLHCKISVIIKNIHFKKVVFGSSVPLWFCQNHCCVIVVSSSAIDMQISWLSISMDFEGAKSRHNC